MKDEGQAYFVVTKRICPDCKNEFKEKELPKLCKCGKFIKTIDNTDTYLDKEGKIKIN